MALVANQCLTQTATATGSKRREQNRKDSPPDGIEANQQLVSGTMPKQANKTEISNFQNTVLNKVRNTR